MFTPKELLLAPNVLTLLRVPLALSFPFAASSRVGALVVLGAAGLTDVLDGFVARHTGHITATGAFLDPFADKVFAASVVGTLVVTGRLPLWGCPALVARELLEAPLGIYMFYEARHGVAPPVGDVFANVPGKIATVVQFATIVVALEAPAALPAMLAVAAVTGVAAGVAYWRRELARRADKNGK